MPRTKSAKRRKKKDRLNLRPSNGQERYAASMLEDPTGIRLRASAKNAKSGSMDVELNRLMDNDKKLAELLATQEG